MCEELQPLLGLYQGGFTAMVAFSTVGSEDFKKAGIASKHLVFEPTKRTGLTKGLTTKTIAEIVDLYSRIKKICAHVNMRVRLVLTTLGVRWFSIGLAVGRTASPVFWSLWGIWHPKPSPENPTKTSSDITVFADSRRTSAGYSLTANEARQTNGRYIDLVEVSKIWQHP
ncbi:hypothetical protein BYT27DRAFT_7244303 [Phlegmacium glaucopus]|nr:hypothetical protein BYT27DRAFT_7244303 [Phlegmacium glaucopus]